MSQTAFECLAKSLLEPRGGRFLLNRPALLFENYTHPVLLVKLCGNTQVIVCAGVVAWVSFCVILAVPSGACVCVSVYVYCMCVCDHPDPQNKFT